MSTVELKPHAPRFVREAKPVIDRVWSARLVTTRRVDRLRESEVRALRDTCEHSPHDAIASRPQKAEGVRRGQPGVLWVRHPAQASGYANLPAQTQAQFRDGWFCSRDLFVRDDAGYFVHQGRADELVKVAGQWVQPGELEEAVVLEAAVAEAACVPVVDADGLERLALFVTARGDAAEAVSAAAAACERALPRHKRPKWVRAVPELPRTATGKVQRFKLREMARANPR